MDRKPKRKHKRRTGRNEKEEKVGGGRVEFREDENSLTALMAGKAKFHIYLTPPSPLQEMEFTLEYDVSYLSAALEA